MRLLVTRPEPEASAMAEELRSLGHEPVIQPLMEFTRIEFDPQLLLLAPALIITSGNALRALRESGHLERLTQLPLFCVGEETARRALALGFRTIVDTADSAERLAEVIAGQADGDELLVHGTGEHQAFDLSQALSLAGLPIHTLRVYGMRARGAFESWLVEMLKAKQIDGVILMSPRTAEIFMRLCETAGLGDSMRTLLYFCLSASVCEKLSPVRSSLMRVASKPSRQAILDLLA